MSTVPMRIVAFRPESKVTTRRPLSVASIPVALVCFVAATLAADRPAMAKKSWYDVPSERGRKAERTAAAREDFSDPPRAYRLIFGPQAERDLQAAIRRYQAIVAAGGWPRVPKGPGLGPGSQDDRVSYLRRRLLASGDLPRSVGDGRKYKSAVVEAVKRFQLRHGLKPTGRVYRSTLQALNVPAERRLAQLRLNLDRIRKLADQLKGGRYVLVNIPAYELQAINGGRVELYSRAITGKPNTPTPVLSARIRALDFLPYWNVPASIAGRALIPTVARDPDYLAREHIRVFSGKGEVDSTKVNWSGKQARSYRFRQDPGPFNALGVVRLDMPNKHIVYMHDTPLQRLFRYGVRAYSAGCVRVHKIFPLAEWLLRGNGGWSQGRIASTVAAARSETVKLATPVPVHLVYVTAWGSGDGTAQFRLDVYNRDGAGRVVAELEGPKEQISALAP